MNNHLLKIQEKIKRQVSHGMMITVIANINTIAKPKGPILVS